MKIKHFKVLVSLGVALLAIGAVSTAITFPAAVKKTQLAMTKQFDATKINTIKLNGKAMDVHLEESSDKNIHVSLNGHARSTENFDIKTKQTGDELDISFKTEKESSPNIVFFLDTSDQYVTLSLPKSVENVNVQTNYGQISGDGLTGKKLNVQTNAGEIYLSNLSLNKLSATLNGGKISLIQSKINESTISADAGEIAVHQLLGETSTFKTITGEIDLEQIATDSIQSSTKAGSIELRNKTIDQQIDFQAEFGSINIQTQSQPTNATIKADVKLGDASIFNQNLKTQTFGKGEHLINTRTAGGEITITDESSSNYDEEDYD